MKRARTTEDEFDIEQDAGQGWEVVNSEKTSKLARASLKEYRENQPEFSVRIKKHRVRIVTRSAS